jgi:hypothetical protein
MYDRNPAYGSHGSPPARSPRTRSRRARRRRAGSILAAAACIGVLVAGYFLFSPHASRATSAADVQGYLPGTSGGEAGGGETGGGETGGGETGGGWGEGGYPMMSGPPDGAAGGGAAGGGAAGGGAAGGGAAGGGAAGGGAVNGPAGPAASAAAVTQVTSANWAGYAETGAAGSFTSVSASWAQPAVGCGAADPFSAFWAGLDGDGTATVEQTGTEADCADGAATYQGWYEVFPAAPVFFANPVQPGDAMSASVVSDGGGLFTLTLSDATQGWTQTTQQTAANAQLGSAEIIAEAPSSGDSVLPLADFGTVNFTGATADGAPIGNSANLSELTMSSAAGTVLAAPSALTSASAFSVTAAGGGTATAVPGTGTGGGSGGDSRRHHHRDWDWGL